MEMGLVHLYTGSGKGKTTAAVGMAIRAAGRNKRVVFCQFMKDNDSGEIPVLASVPGIEVILDNPFIGFISYMNQERRREAAGEQQEKWKKAVRLAQEADMLILDEVLDAILFNLIPVEWVTGFLKTKPAGLEVVLTGHSPLEEITPLCDYYSEITAKAHPFYKRRVPAREGIEY